MGLHLGAVCVPYPQDVRVVLGQELGSASTADTQLLITENPPICSFYSLKIERRKGNSDLFSHQALTFTSLFTSHFWKVIHFLKLGMDVLCTQLNNVTTCPQGGNNRQIIVTKDPLLRYVAGDHCLNLYCNYNFIGNNNQ